MQRVLRNRTRTASLSILIYSRLNALAVNFSQLSGRLCLHAGLIGSSKLAGSRHRTGDELDVMDLFVCANPSSPSSWVWVGECFFWYRLTRVVPDKWPLNGRVFVCVCVWVCVLVSLHYESSISLHKLANLRRLANPQSWLVMGLI